MHAVSVLQFRRELFQQMKGLFFLSQTSLHHNTQFVSRPPQQKHWHILQHDVWMILLTRTTYRMSQSKPVFGNNNPHQQMILQTATLLLNSPTPSLSRHKWDTLGKRKAWRPSTETHRTNSIHSQTPQDKKFCVHGSLSSCCVWWHNTDLHNIH